jgi:PAT family beta-lactamase induction signal transducer AmpG
VLAFVLLFKLPDVMTGRLTLRFMLDIGIPELEIGAVRQGLGVFMTIAGALVGGAIVARMRLWPSLWLFGILQAVSNLGFWILAQTGPHRWTMVSVVAVENFCTGLVVAGFTAFLMSQCNPRFSATQFALLTSLMALSRDIGGAPAGYLVHALGWSNFFALSVLAALPGMALLPWLREHSAPPLPSEKRGFEVITES